MSRGDEMLSNLSRRALLGGIAALTLPLPAWGAADSGFRIDWQGGERTPAVAASLARQIEIVEKVRVSDRVRDFFAAQVITVDREAGTKTRAGPRGIFFARTPVPADEPVLLHELIHRWQLERMPGGQANADVHRFYDQARASGLYPAQSYMLSNAFEFFAMTASAVLYGTLARPPFRRENVRRKSPELYAFITREFGFEA